MKKVILGLCFLGAIMSPLPAKETPILARNPEALAMALANLGEKGRLALGQIEIQHDFKEERIAVKKYRGGFKDFTYLPEIPIGDYLDDIKKTIDSSAKREKGVHHAIVISGAIISFSAGAEGMGAMSPEVETALMLAIDTGASMRSTALVRGLAYHSWISYKKDPKTQLYYAEATYRALMVTMLQEAKLLTNDEALRIGLLMPPRE